MDQRFSSIDRKSRVSRREPYQVFDFAVEMKIAPDQTRELVRVYGNDREVLEREARKLRDRICGAGSLNTTAAGQLRGATMYADLSDFDDLRALVRSRKMSREEAQNLAHNATSAILDVGTGDALCQELIATLETIAIGDWLGREVGFAMRERAADLLNQIELATSAANANYRH